MSESPRYIWFSPETVQALRDQLNAASDEAVLVVRGQSEHMTLEVVDGAARIADEAPASVLNEAHPCPPFCR